jgi:hypothetical protein
MEAGVLNDDEHPTPDSKYWQAIGEQSVHLRELINLSYESKKLIADNNILEAEIDELNWNILQPVVEGKEFIVNKLKAECEKKKIQLDQNKFSIIQQHKVAKERMKEIRNWEGIIAGIKPDLKFGDEDWEKHHPERYFLRYKRRMDRFDTLNPQDRENVLSHFTSFARHPENKELAYQSQLPPLLEGTLGPPVNSAQIDFNSKEEMEEKDFIAKSYFNRKVRRIYVCSPHRISGERASTNFQVMQTPAAYDVVLEEPWGFTVPDARNFMVEKAIKAGADYIFFVDDDLIIPRLSLVSLLHHDAEVVGGFYYRKYFPLESCGMHEDFEGYPTAIKNFTLNDIIHNTLVLPSGCTLIKVDVLKRMGEDSWYKSITIKGKPTITEDTYFCQKVRELGVDIITDCGIQCIHVDKEQGIFYGHPEIVQNNQVIEKYLNIYAV